MTTTNTVKTTANEVTAAGYIIGPEATGDRPRIPL